uniref:Putative secreted protein n=1 Tax=Anopheles triannulatus TaxID=58253 RepID=A0A2M4B6Y8_9DIPT
MTPSDSLEGLRFFIPARMLALFALLDRTAASAPGTVAPSGEGAPDPVLTSVAFVLAGVVPMLSSASRLD